MRTFIISDLHGHEVEFKTILKTINFQPDDKMYILGDVIDRGEKPIDLLEYILSQPNMILLKGNHEQMMYESYRGNKFNREPIKEMWLYNGGEITLAQFEKLSEDKKEELLDKIRELPYYEKIEVNNKKYFLSHAGILLQKDTPFNWNLRRQIENQDILWNRDELLHNENYSEFIMIHGHTPTIYWDSWNASQIYYYDNDKKINIDCGCAGEYKMGCICLDTGREYYVKC